MQTLTLNQFRADHGDPARWCASEIDSYLVFGDIAPPAPAPFTFAEMQEVAACYAESAEREQAVADSLASKGHTEAADLWARGAETSARYAAAARLGYPAYEAALNS
ncbi:hypothetical protein OG599_34690 (plasmid) [Streptomyces sp. NBC_01335]|uniref:hypothetical protein n=1 Tax=Streptomyces sp. NBC_01335 TaxID=2903828 RepID=UPI002E158175|nr:hypothetical protein OG599_34690 [Streptomyces sp. NBC_01335]